MVIVYSQPKRSRSATAVAASPPSRSSCESASIASTVSGALDRGEAPAPRKNCSGEADVDEVTSATSKDLHELPGEPEPSLLKELAGAEPDIARAAWEAPSPEARNLDETAEGIHEATLRVFSDALQNITPEKA